jgi:hypothetical protein
MTYWTWTFAAVVLAVPVTARAFIEAPYTLGRFLTESTHVAVVEVAQINKERNLIIFKKVRDVKGKHPAAVIKHNIGKRGNPGDWEAVMAWAAPGKKAVFFHNGQASETCIGGCWYQCFRVGEWWGMSHTEPYLLRTYCGDPEKLAGAVAAMLEGKEVTIPCMADGPREQLQRRKGKLQIVTASLKRHDYNPKRDFVKLAGDVAAAAPAKTVLLVPDGSPGWKFVPAARVQSLGSRWTAADFDDAAWKAGKAPLGNGEPEIAKRKGTTVAPPGQAFAFRRTFDVPAEVLRRHGATFRLTVASDDSATVYLNGTLVDRDPSPDHEFAYWNREVNLNPSQLRPGRNVLAALVQNTPKSSDLYLDVELSALVPVSANVAGNASTKPAVAKSGPAKAPPLPADKLPPELVIDKVKRRVSLPCLIAPRKLPTLKETYPIEVIATYPHPRGQKAHETVVTVQGIRPSMVHRALLNLGLAPGQPARGQGARPTGPALDVSLEWMSDGKTRHLPLEKVLIDTRTGKPPPPLAWHFTGSAPRQPDPEKDDVVYGANVTGTFLTIYPVTDETVIQAAMPPEAESTWRLETNAKLLPRTGTPARLVLQAK